MGIKNRAVLILALIMCQHMQVFASTADSDVKEAITNLGETYEFQAEIGRLMDIIINSLYTNKEIFLREIISNASDALDKIRFLAVSEPGILKDQPELYIEIEFDPEAKTVSIYDSGIGMTKADLINNLGTIAKSGTTNFVQALAQGQSLNLIGQFGVGFYSTFLAGNKVTVITKNANDDQYIWESSAAHSFNIRKDPDGSTLKRGTKIIIDLKQDSYEFAEENKLRELIKRYSEFINFNIKLKVQKEISKEVPADEEPVDEKKEGEDTPKKDDLEIKDDEGEKKPTTETVTEKVWDWEIVNDNKAIWLRPREDLTKEDYTNFYKAISKEYDAPLTYIHFNAEGEVEFKSILFVPGHAPQNMYENYYSKTSTLKLYVRRVLINENFEDLLPKYLSFVRGVIDSDDLPINVSRESLQQVKMLKVMGRKLTKKVLEMLKKLSEGKADEEESDEEESDEEESKKTDSENTTGELSEKEKKRQAAKDKYNDFWKEFGKNIKLGIIEDATNRQKLTSLTRWYTSRNISELTSFDDYIKRMKPGQEHIYYIGGESKEALLKAPAIQKLLKKGYEVVLLDDPVDEFCLQNVYDYEKKSTINVGKGSFVMPGDDKLDPKRLKALKKYFQPLTDWWKGILSDKLDQITISERITDDPCIVVGSVYGYSAQMEKVSKAQAYGPNNPMATSKRNLEINPGHPVIKELAQRLHNGTPDTETEEMATLLYEAALLNSGFPLSDPREFSNRFFKIFNPAMGISKDAPIEDVEVEIDENDDSPDVNTYSTPNGQNVREEVSDNQIKMSFDEPPGFKEKREEAERKKAEAEAAQEKPTDIDL